MAPTPTTGQRILAARLVDPPGARFGATGGEDGVGWLLIATVGYGALFEARDFPRCRFRDTDDHPFRLAMVGAELIERVERKVGYYAGAR